MLWRHGDAYPSAPCIVGNGGDSSREDSVVFCDENGNETERATLDADDWPRMLNVENYRWHSLECLESGSVLFECKDEAYHPLEEMDIMVK